MASYGAMNIAVTAPVQVSMPAVSETDRQIFYLERAYRLLGNSRWVPALVIPLLYVMPKSRAHVRIATCASAIGLVNTMMTLKTIEDAKVGYCELPGSVH